MTDCSPKAVSTSIIFTKQNLCQSGKISPFSMLHTPGTMLSLSLKSTSHRTDIFAGMKDLLLTLAE